MKPGTDFIGVSIGALILNEKNEIFITKRGARATNERGTWEIPGGKVHFGETLQNAVKREIKEEYGVDIKLLHQFPTQTHLIPKEKQHWIPTCFIAKITKEIPKILEPEKCEAIGWFSLDNLPKPLSIITNLDLASYRKYLNGEKA